MSERAWYWEVVAPNGEGILHRYDASTNSLEDLKLQIADEYDIEEWTPGTTRDGLTAALGDWHTDGPIIIRPRYFDAQEAADGPR